MEYIFFLHIETASVLSSLSHALNELFLLWRLCLLSSFRDQKKQNISQCTNLMFLGFLPFSVCLSVLWCLQYFALCDLVLFINHKNYHKLFFFQVLMFHILSYPNLAMWLWAFLSCVECTFVLINPLSSNLKLSTSTGVLNYCLFISKTSTWLVCVSSLSCYHVISIPLTIILHHRREPPLWLSCRSACSLCLLFLHHISQMTDMLV